MTTLSQSANPRQSGAGPGHPLPSAKELWLIFPALMMVLILASLDQSVVNTALPRMASDLGGLTHLSWVVMAFLLASTVSTPIYGKLSDMYGRRRLLVISITIFLIASGLCGFSQDMLQLILFRGLQGLGAGGLVTLTQTTIGDLVGPQRRGRYQGIFTGTMAFSSVAGPLIGGVLTTELSWRWVFYVNLPTGALALFLIFVALHHKPPITSHRVDFPGAVLLAGATICALLVLSLGGSSLAWGSPVTIGLTLLSAGLALLFIRQERLASEPLLDLSMFRIHSFVRGVAIGGCMAFAMTGTMVFMPLYFQLVLGLDPARAGWMTIPQVGVMIMTSVIGGQLSSRSGLVKPFMILGVGCEALALVICAVLAWSGAGVPYFLLMMGLLGFGMGMGMPNTTVVIQNSVPRAHLGVATATMGFIRSLGGVFGAAISGNVMAVRLGKGRELIDAHQGITHLQAMAGPMRESYISTYRHAIALSISLSSVVMVIALLLVLTLRGVRMGETQQG